MNALKLGLSFAMVISMVIADISPDYKYAPAIKRPRKIIENKNGLSKSVLVTEMNEFLDSILRKLNRFIKAKYNSRQDLPDILDRDLSWDLEMSGKLSLTNMRLNGLSTLKRMGNVSIEMTTDKIFYHYPVIYGSLVFNGDYSFRLTLITHKGTLEGRVIAPCFMVVIEVDRITLKAKLYDLEQYGFWRITSYFSGNLGNLLSIVSDKVKIILPPFIKATTRNFTLGGVNSTLAVWNRE